MKKIILPLLLLIWMNTFEVIPQQSFTFHAGASIPIGDFSDDNFDNEDASGASTGFNLGGKYLYKFNESNLGLFLAADFNYNGIQSSIKDDIENEFKDLGMYVNIDYYRFINVPITGGLNLSIPAEKNITFWVESGIGIDFLKVTNMNVYTNYQKLEVSYKLSTQFAYTVGGGFVFNDKFVIGLHYNGLGLHKPKGTIKLNGYSETYRDRARITTLTLNLGIKF